MKKQVKPTEAELEILNVLWERGEATVRDVHDVLGQNKDAGYTTTLKLMQIMLDKGLLKRDTSSKTHLYKAAVNRDIVRRQIVGRLIDSTFSGSATQLVMQALGNYRTSTEELAQIKAYLEEIEKKQKNEANK